MVPKRRLRFFLLGLVLLGIALVLFAPLLMPPGIRLLARWQASRQGLKITIDKINAPLLRPIELSGMRIVSQPDCAFQIDLNVPRAEIDLDLGAVIKGSRDRALRRLSLHGLSCDVKRTATSSSAKCRLDWGTLHWLLPDELEISNSSFHLENGESEADLRGLYLSASEIAAGRMLVRDVKISTPFFRQELRNLRGAASWENDRLTLGAIEITRGVDLESVTVDFARLKRRQVGLEMNLDAFGGKLRTSISIENRNDVTTWDVAGTASAISLAQLSEAARLATPARGSVRASKFTFRGDLRDFSHATASIWAEVTNLTWRERTAETIMLGASLYNRHIQVEQLYVKQLRNEFTLTGEYLLPDKSSDWLSPDFQGDISASISDLGDFARLFGGAGTDFAGVLSIRGKVSERDRKISGQITMDGESLRVFRAPVDVMTATLGLQGSEMQVEKFEAVRGNDFFRAKGNLDLAHEHKYSGSVNGYAEKIADYAAMLPDYWRQQKPDGSLTFNWNGSGDFATHSGDLQLQVQHLQIRTGFDLAPFDVSVNGKYSPRSFFFQEFRISNERATLSAYVTVAGNYLQVQMLRLDLSGKPVLQGNVFLPLQLNDFVRDGDFFGALDTSRNCDVDLSLAASDLGEFSIALTGRQGISGMVAGTLKIYGRLGSFKLSSDVFLQNLAVAKDPAKISGEIHARTEANTLKLQAQALPTGSDAIILDTALPLLPAPKESPTHAVLALDQAATATLDFPLIMIAKLPRYLKRDEAASGILSGKLILSQTLRNPGLNGDAQLIDGQFRDSSLHPFAASGRVLFTGSEAEVEFLNLASGEGSARFHGDAEFASSRDISIRVRPDTPVTNLMHYSTNECIHGFAFSLIGRTDSGHKDRKPAGSGGPEDTGTFSELSEAVVRSPISNGPWTLALVEQSWDNFFKSEKETKTEYRLCPGESSRWNILQLGVSNLSKSDRGHDPLAKFRSGR